MIKKVSGGYVVVSEKGKRLSKILPTKAAAVDRLREVEFSLGIYLGAVFLILTIPLAYWLGWDIWP